MPKKSLHDQAVAANPPSKRKSRNASKTPLPTGVPPAPEQAIDYASLILRGYDECKHDPETGKAGSKGYAFSIAKRNLADSLGVKSDGIPKAHIDQLRKAERAFFTAIAEMDFKNESIGDWKKTEKVSIKGKDGNEEAYIAHVWKGIEKLERSQQVFRVAQEANLARNAVAEMCKKDKPAEEESAKKRLSSVRKLVVRYNKFKAFVRKFNEFMPSGKPIKVLSCTLTGWLLEMDEAEQKLAIEAKAQAEALAKAKEEARQNAAESSKAATAKAADEQAKSGFAMVAGEMTKPYVPTDGDALVKASQKVQAALAPA